MIRYVGALLPTPMPIFRSPGPILTRRVPFLFDILYDAFFVGAVLLFSVAIIWFIKWWGLRWIVGRRHIFETFILRFFIPASVSL